MPKTAIIVRDTRDHFDASAYFIGLENVSGLDGNLLKACDCSDLANVCMKALMASRRAEVVAWAES
jgi:hypothetical protein